MYSYSYKVCHSSAFQAISVRSVYVKIIKYSGSILASLNSTLQTKQHSMKKPKRIFKYKQDILGTIFLVEGFLTENVKNLQFLLIQLVETVFNISLFLEVLFFLSARNI